MQLGDIDLIHSQMKPVFKIYTSHVQFDTVQFDLSGNCSNRNTSFVSCTPLGSNRCLAV